MRACRLHSFPTDVAMSLLEALAKIQRGIPADADCCGSPS